MSFSVPADELKLLVAYGKALAAVTEEDFPHVGGRIKPGSFVTYAEFKKNVLIQKELRRRDPGGNIHL